MTGLRYVACEACETVAARGALADSDPDPDPDPGPDLGLDLDPDSHDRCAVCGAQKLKDITASLATDEYFTAALREDREETD